MTYEPEGPFGKSSELGTLLNLSPELIDAARLKAYEGEELIMDARSNDRRQKWTTWPGGVVLSTCLAASVFGFVPKNQDEEFPLAFNAAFMLAASVLIVGRVSDREKALRNEVMKRMIGVAVERDIKIRHNLEG